MTAVTVSSCYGSEGVLLQRQVGSNGVLVIEVDCFQKEPFS